MTSKDEDKSPLPAYVCVMDAQEKNKQHRSTYSQSEIDFSDQFFSKVGACYDSRTWRNFREKFISIKVENPSITNRKSKAAKTIESFCKKNGIEITTHGSHLIYRIPKV